MLLMRCQPDVGLTSRVGTILYGGGNAIERRGSSTPDKLWRVERDKSFRRIWEHKRMDDVIMFEQKQLQISLQQYSADIVT